MHVRFLLGAAGTGKTSRCLEEVREALLQRPEGAPLIFVAPKQATFQIERQLLTDERLQGFSRLFIVSFERLAQTTIEALALNPPRLLSEQGRLMVLRALLSQKERAHELKLFRASARLPGFAQDLSKVIRECQHAQAGPAALRKAAADPSASRALASKLQDIALLFEGYNAWLESEKLNDADQLLDIAAHALTEKHEGMEQVTPLFDGLWLDGFAEMTVQEIALLKAAIPWCGKATLAFCCEKEALEPNANQQFSHLTVVGQTARRCLHAISTSVGVEVISLRRDVTRSRFSESPALAALEQHWGAAVHKPEADQEESSQHDKGAKGEFSGIRLVACATPEAEVVFSAREICRHVRKGGRYRDVAVLVREMTPYQDVIRRVFAQYGIPCFLDRRETVAHHPLAELTRYAMRTVSREWAQEEWLGVLKSGLVSAEAAEMDCLENECLARGWDGAALKLEKPSPDVEPRLNELRNIVSGPLREFEQSISREGTLMPNGAELAAALRKLWSAFSVEQQLADWTAAEPGNAVHDTVWDQMTQWLEIMRLGFEHQSLTLREWLPVVEAGLAGLTVGVIPPLLDEVLVGSIDRSRNPDLRVAFVLGVNEGAFPKLPSNPPLLTERERAQMSSIESQVWLGPGKREQLAHELFYGYIAFTRSREKLFVTWSEADRQGRPRHPSSLVTRLKLLFPALAPESFDVAAAPDVVHASELAVPLLRASWNESANLSAPGGRRRLEEAQQLLMFDDAPQQSPRQVAEPSALRTLLGREPFRRLRYLAPHDRSTERRLAPEVVSRLYGRDLKTSISRLEEFASCAYRFFITVGLKAKERLQFEVDARQTGTFQHEVLMAFHQRLKRQQLRWRDMAPVEARTLLGTIAREMRPHFKNGVLLKTDRDRIESDHLITALEEFIETVVGWAQQYEFDPVEVELKFGDKDAALPAWEFDLAGGNKLIFRGSIDRVDALVDVDQKHAALVVIDYKSSGRSVDEKMLDAGVQMQLFAYLAALRRLEPVKQLLRVETISPAGVFYVSLRGSYKAAKIRDEALADPAQARRAAYQHRGRFIKEMLERFDRDAITRKKGEQFAFRVVNGGGCHGSDTDPMCAEEFNALLDSVEQRLVAMGNSIFAGDISINPYRTSALVACDRCDYSGICRIDPASHEFRALRVTGGEAE